MSTSSVSSSLLSQLDPTSGSSDLSKMKQAWQQLASSLSSGDLEGAQTAFAAITQMQQQKQTAGGSDAKSQNSQLQTDMNALGQALQSGNLSDAQSAFAAVQKDLSAAGRHHHHASQSSSSAGVSQTEVEALLSGNGNEGASSTSASSVSTYA